MARPLPAVRLRFQTKVLVPVVSILVVLVVVPLWVITQRMSSQLEAAAADNLRANDAELQSLQRMRARNLLLRCRNTPNEPRFKAVMRLSDRKTLQFLLQEVREELSCDVTLFADGEGNTLAGATLNASLPLAPFTTNTSDSVQAALGGEPDVAIIGILGKPYDVVSIPVTVGEEVVGALVFVSEIGEAAAKEFTLLTRSEVALLVGD